MHPPQETIGLRAKPDTILKKEANQVLRNANIEEAKTKLLKEALDFQNVLYNFKVKSANIQCDMQLALLFTTFNFDVKLSNNVCQTKNSLLSTLVAFNKELTAAKSVIAEHCKHSINPIEKLKELEAIVFYKRISIKWASADLKALFMLRKQINHVLSMTNNIEITELPIQFPSPKYKDDTTASKRIASLISELKSMIIEFTTLAVKSKFSKIHLETSKQTTTNPLNEPIATSFGVKPTNANNVNPSTLSTPPQASPPTTSSKLESPSAVFRFPASKPLNFEWPTNYRELDPKLVKLRKYTKVAGVTARSICENSTKETHAKLPNTPLKCTPAAKEIWHDLIGTELVGFRTLVGTDVIIKSGETNNITVHYQCITLMEEYEGTSLEELRLTDYAQAARRGRKYAAVFALPEEQLRNIEFFYAQYERTVKWQDDSFVTFKPRVECEEIIDSGVTKNLTVTFYCITLMPEFQNKSLEEVRLESYVGVRRSSIPRTYTLSIELKNSFFGAEGSTSPWEKFKNDSRKSAIQFPTTCPTGNFKFSKECEEKSFEELRLDDYMSGRSKAASFGGTTPRGLSSKPKQDTDSVSFIRIFYESGSKVKYQCITVMAEYENQSLEEIRLFDYIQAATEGRKYAPVFASSQKHLMNIAFFYVKSLTEKLRLRPPQLMFSPQWGISSDVLEDEDTRYQCINIMPRYRNKSLEEIRLEDYVVSLCNKLEATKFMRTGLFAPTETQETTTQNNQTPERDSTKKMRVTPTQKNQASGHNPTPRETPSQKNQIPERDSTTKTPETPTQKNQASGHNPTPQPRETPSQKNQTPERDSTTKTPETPTQKNQASGHNQTPQPRETPSQKNQTPERDSTTKTPETPTQQSHNTSRRDPSPQTPETPINEKYEKAVKIANEALKLNPENPLHLTERAAAFLMLRNYKQALEDAQKAVAIDSTFITGYILTAKCCIKLGDIACGEVAVKRGIDLLKELRGNKPLRDQGNESTNCATKHKTMLELETRLKELRSNQEAARKLMDQDKYHHALDLINCCLDNYCPSCYKTKLLKAECLANIGKYQEAQDIAINLSLFERYDADAIYVVGLCLFKQDKLEQALENFRKVNKLDPDNEKAAKMYKITKTSHTNRLLQRKKEEGNQAFKNGKFEFALQLYTEALDININDNHMNATLHYNKATVYVKLNQTRDAEQACTVALHLKPDYIKALERRAQCCTELGEHEDAVEDYKKLVELYKRANLTDCNIKRLLRKAEKVLEKFKRSNYYYKILGVKNTATPHVIKQFYRKRSLLCHPDKVQEKCVADRGARRFKRIKEACDFLCDTQKRRDYDKRQKDYHDDDDDENSDNSDH